MPTDVSFTILLFKIKRNCEHMFIYCIKHSTASCMVYVSCFSISLNDVVDLIPSDWNGVACPRFSNQLFRFLIPQCCGSVIVAHLPWCSAWSFPLQSAVFFYFRLLCIILQNIYPDFC